MIKHVISMSTGKDSEAVGKLAVDRCGRDNVIGILCDTGNEHHAVFEHRKYLEQALGIEIVILKADFTEQIAAKRMYIARDLRHRREYETEPVFENDGVTPVPKRDGRGNIVMRKVKREGVMVVEPVQKTVKVGGGRRVRWSNKAKRRALENLHPTGIPFLDLCMWKGKFPSRKLQFCTEQLKTLLAVEFQMELVDKGYKVISWQGVRRDESLNRRNAKKIERLNPGMWAFRPIVDWSAMDVVTYCVSHGLKLNPLYSQGMDRVGCMPCINVRKDELREIARRYPEYIYERAEWEKKVALCSKRGLATFFPAPNLPNHIAAKQTIMVKVEWSKTTRGGKQYDLLGDVEEATVCASSYGLCG